MRATRYLYGDSLVDGIIATAGKVYDVVSISALEMKLQGSSDPDLVKLYDNGSGSSGVYGYGFDKAADQELFFSASIPYSVFDSTNHNITLVVKSMATTVAADSTSVWAVELTAASIGSSFPANTTLTSLEQVYTTANKVERSSQVTVGNLSEGGMIFGRIARDADNAADDLDNDAILLGVDIIFSKKYALGAKSATPSS